MTQTEARTRPTHVVIDTRDGYTFYRGSADFFTAETAKAFADKRNAEMIDPTYAVARLDYI